MKKLQLLLLTFTLILSLTMGIVACGGTGSGDGTGEGGGGENTPPVIENVAGTEGLAYEVVSPKKGSAYATCIGIGTATDTDIVIASHYENYVVKEIDDKAFRGNKTITSLTVVNGMEKISMYAFEGCTSLFSVTISQTVNNIGQNAFYNCENLLNICNDSALDIKIGSIQYGYIGNYACNIFSSTGGGKGEFITEGDYEYFTFPNNKYAMKYLGNETSIEIPHGVTGLYKDLFKGNENLKEIYIPKTVESIGKMAFADCTALEEVTIAENTKLTSVGESAFSGCESLTTYNFNADLATYLKVQYAGDTSNPCYYTNDIILLGDSIYELAIPAGTPEIGQHSFVNCETIKKLLVPSSVEVIGAGAFARCYNLQQLWFVDSTNSKLAHVKDNAFTNCTKLESVDFPKSVEIIDVKAFNECIGLLTVTFENNSKLTSINEKGFYACKSLQSVKFGHNSSLKIVGKEAFMNCAKLGEFNLGNNSKLERIEAQGLYQCRKMREIYLPISCKFIGGYAFGGCFDGLRDDPNTPYMKIYVEAAIRPVDWSTNYNSSNCPVFYGVPYPVYPE